MELCRLMMNLKYRVFSSPLVYPDFTEGVKLVVE